MAANCLKKVWIAKTSPVCSWFGVNSQMCFIYLLYSAVSAVGSLSERDICHISSVKYLRHRLDGTHPKVLVDYCNDIHEASTNSHPGI